MRLGARHAFLTRVLADGRVLDVQPWPDGRVRLLVSASARPYALLAVYWYAALLPAVRAALLWDGTDAPSDASHGP